MLVLIDAAIEQLLLNGTAEVEVMQQRYRAIDIDKLGAIRKQYERLADADATRGARRGPIIQAFR